MRWIITFFSLFFWLSTFCTMPMAAEKETPNGNTDPLRQLKQEIVQLSSSGKLPAAAEDAWEKILPKVAREAGKDSALYALCLAKLAESKLENHKLDQATKLVEEAIEHHTAAAGKDLDLADLLRQLSRYLQYQHKYALAQDKSRQALAIVEEKAGKQYFLYTVIKNEIEDISNAASVQEKRSKLKEYLANYPTRVHKTPVPMEENKKYYFILMVRDDPQVVARAEMVLQMLKTAGYRAQMFDKVSDSYRLYRANRQDGHTYLGLDSSLPYEVMERILDGLIPIMDPNTEVELMNMAADDYFLIWML